MVVPESIQKLTKTIFLLNKTHLYACIQMVLYYDLFGPNIDVSMCFVNHLFGTLVIYNYQANVIMYSAPIANR